MIQKKLRMHYIWITYDTKEAWHSLHGITYDTKEALHVLHWITYDIKEA